MSSNFSRASRADHPRSTYGTLSRRAPRRPVRVGIVALIGLAMAAPMVVGAEPAAAPPSRPVAVAAPAEAVRSRPIAEPGDQLVNIGRALYVVGAGGVGSVEQVPPPAPPPPPTTTTTTAPPPPPTTTPAPAPAPAPAPKRAAPAVPTGSVWDRLAQCEASGNWSINTGNGYYGGLQFSAASWRAVGGTGLPHQASRETQIAMGERLRAAQGWGAWPSCASKLGLR